MTLQQWMGGTPAAPPAAPPATQAAAIAPETVVTDRIPAADDTDTATAQTIAKMCDYIAKVQKDPQVKRAARFAWSHFGCRKNEPLWKVWAVFWYVKHCIKFQLDEGAMMRIGEPGQQDLLTAPDVLLRMDSPAEDC